MSGGIAYVWDADGDFQLKCNLGTVGLERVETDHDLSELLVMIEMHYQYTDSPVAQRLIEDWPVTVRREFVKVMPIDYKRVLVERALHDEEQESAIRLDISGR